MLNPALQAKVVAQEDGQPSACCTPGILRARLQPFPAHLAHPDGRQTGVVVTGTQRAKLDIRKAQQALRHKCIDTTARHYVLDELEAGSSITRTSSRYEMLSAILSRHKKHTLARRLAACGCLVRNQSGDASVAPRVYLASPIPLLATPGYSGPYAYREHHDAL